MNKKIILISILAGLLLSVTSLLVVYKSIINLDAIKIDISGLVANDSSEPKYINGSPGGADCYDGSIYISYKDYGFPATSVAELDSFSCLEIVDTAYIIYFLGFIFNWVFYGVLFGLIIFLLSNIIKIISWGDIKRSIAKRKSLILCLLMGLVLTLTSFVYSSSYDPFNNQKLFPIVTPFSIRLSEPEKDYIYTDLDDLRGDRFLEGQGMPLITNRGFPAAIIITSGYFYPIGFIFNWAFYSALVGAGVFGYKKLKNRNLKS